MHVWKEIKNGQRKSSKKKRIHEDKEYVAFMKKAKKKS